jgi:hypothetical protein
MPEYNTSKCCPHCWSETGFYWEYNTSKNCPRCHGTSAFARKGDWRSKECSNQCISLCDDGTSREFRWDRDIGAALNMFHVAAVMAATGGYRPLPFARPEHFTGCDRSKRPTISKYPRSVQRAVLIPPGVRSTPGKGRDGSRGQSFYHGF